MREKRCGRTGRGNERHCKTTKAISKIGWWVKALAALPDKLSLTPRMHMVEGKN